MRYFLGLVMLIAACGPTMSPKEAYDIESARCDRVAKQDSEMGRRCQSMVDKKYAQYFGEGEIR